MNTFLVRHDVFRHNVTILWYTDIYFPPKNFLLCELQIFFSGEHVYTNAYEMQQQNFDKNVFLSFYWNKFLSKYRNIVRKNVVCEAGLRKNIALKNSVSKSMCDTLSTLLPH